MPDVTVRPGQDGSVEFAVTWAEPVTITFGTRSEAEHYAAWLRATGRTAGADGICQACAANHAHGHACPSCQADLSLRVGFLPGARHGRRPVDLTPDRFLIPRAQAALREEIAARARDELLAPIPKPVGAWRPAASM